MKESDKVDIALASFLATELTKKTGMQHMPDIKAKIIDIIKKGGMDTESRLIVSLRLAYFADKYNSATNAKERRVIA